MREQCDLDARAARLKTRLEVVAANMDRPNNALWARTLLLLGRLNAAMLAGDRDAIPPIWPEFSKILVQARGLGEFEATRLVKLIETVGNAAGNDPAYNFLIEEVADFVTERTWRGRGRSDTSQACPEARLRQPLRNDPAARESGSPTHQEGVCGEAHRGIAAVEFGVP